MQASVNEAPSAKELIEAYRLMLTARLADEKIITLYKQNKCHFHIGVAGHEAVQAAAATVFRPGIDWFYPYYRDMALVLGLGMSLEEVMLNAMNKLDDPSSHGRQMPMHWGSVPLNVVNQSSPTGTQFLQAVGCAHGSKYLGKAEVVYVSSGEGTCAQGDFYEALNWAAREKLPVVFLIENNGIAISVPVVDQFDAQSVYRLTAGYQHLERYEIDGTDFQHSRQVFRNAYDRALSGWGPTLIEAHVPRLQSHSISDNQLKYRSAEEIKKDKERCPVAQLRSLLVKKKALSQENLSALEAEVKQKVDQAADWADQQADPTPADSGTHTLGTTYPLPIPEPTPEGAAVYLVDAINHTLDEELSRDPRCLIFGQDVAGGKGGVFTVTAGLTEKHGVARVFNAPLAESSIVGVAIGLATRGLRPIAEIQFGDYCWTGMMQLRNELAMMRYRSGGDFSCPAVLRIPVGGYIHGGCYHSQNIEATFAHFPGLVIVYPSNASDAKGLLKAAIRGVDPVLFLEHKGLYRQPYAKAPEPASDQLIPIGKAKVVRQGIHATIVTWGALVNRSLLAAKQLESEGLQIEVVDLRTITPFDQETVFESVRKTNRLLIAHEDVLFGGFGAEIAAQVSESCFADLDAPILRLGMSNIAAVPHSPILEAAVLPNEHDVLRKLRDLLAY